MKFNIGDKVISKVFGIGKIIGIKKYGLRYLVEFEKYNRDLHNGGCGEVIEGKKHGKENHCYWCDTKNSNLSRYFEMEDKKIIEPVEEEVIEYKGKKYDVVKDDDLLKKHICGITDKESGNKYYHKVLFLEEHKEEILDDTEKEYLKNIIRPFRDEIKSIKKKKYKDKEYIRFETNRDDEEYFELLSFPSNSMYKDMKLYEPYSLEKLGL